MAKLALSADDRVISEAKRYATLPGVRKATGSEDYREHLAEKYR